MAGTFYTTIRLSLRTASSFALAASICGATACALFPDGNSSPTGRGLGLGCEFQQTGLTTDTAIYYVAVEALAVGSGSALVAGLPSHVFDLNAQMQAVGVTRDSIVGAVIRPGRPPELVISPLPGRHLGWFRAVSAGRGRWTLAFAELAAPRGTPGSEAVAALWTGDYSSEGWSGLRIIDEPTDALAVYASSPLVLHGDTLSWAIPTSRTDWNDEVIIYTRAGAEWSNARLPMQAVMEVTMTTSPHGTYLGVSNADLNGAFELLVFQRRAGWQQVARFTGSRPHYDAELYPGENVIQAVWTHDMPLGEMRAVYSGSAWGDREDDVREIWSRPAMWFPVRGSDVIAVIGTSGNITLVGLDGTSAVLPHTTDIELGGLVRAAADTEGNFWLAGGPSPALRGELVTISVVSFGTGCLRLWPGRRDPGRP